MPYLTYDLGRITKREKELTRRGDGRDGPDYRTTVNCFSERERAG